jgi:hypothetical protein
VDFKLMAKSLYTLSKLEEGRIQPVKPDLRNISEFSSLDEVIAHSLRAPNLIRTQTVTGVTLQSPRLENRPFEDEAILKKLLQYRSQIPVSTRIIRPKPATNTNAEGPSEP